MLLCSSIIVLAWSTTALAQTREGKFDEFNNLNSEEAMARLDLFAVEIKANPNLQGFLVGHSTPYFPDGTMLRYLNGYRDYLVNKRGIPATRLSVVPGEDRRQATFELWLMPEGHYLEAPTSPSRAEPGSTKLFDELHLGKESDCVGDLPLERFELKEGLAFFGEALKQQPAAKAWIIVHPSAKDRAAKTLKTFDTVKSFLAEKYEVGANRILTATGSRRNWVCTEISLWIAPANSAKADEAGYYLRLIDEAEKNGYAVGRVEFVGNANIRDRALRNRFQQLEGDQFKRKPLEQSLKNFNALGVIYPLSLKDVTVALDGQDKLIDISIFLREKPNVGKVIIKD